MDKKKLSQLLIELYANTELKEEFITNPKKVLGEKGIKVPKNEEFKILEETETTKYIVLPYLDEEDNVNAENLERKMSKSIGAF